MSEHSLVSIVITYFDYADYLLEAVSSASAQTYGNLEIVVVDDCSPFSPATEILSGKGIRNLTIVRNTTNLGAAKSCNIGIGHAHGDFIVPLDSDDILNPSYVEKTLALLQSSGCDGVYTQTRVFGDQEFIHIPDCSLINVMSGRPGPTTFLYAREIHDCLGGYKVHIYHHDNEFWLSALERGYQFKRLEEPLYHYRKHARARSNSNRSLELPQLLNEHKELYVRHFSDFVQAQEEKFWQVKDEYQLLHQSFHELLSEYRRLQEEFAQYVRLQRGDKKDSPLSPASRIARRFKSAVLAATLQANEPDSGGRS